MKLLARRHRRKLLSGRKKYAEIVAAMRSANYNGQAQVSMPRKHIERWARRWLA